MREKDMTEEIKIIGTRQHDDGSITAWGESGRFAHGSTLAECQVELAMIEAREAGYRQARTRLESHADYPALRARQVAWQTWRNQMYSELCQESRRVRNNARCSARRIAKNSMYTESEMGKCESEDRILAETRSAYDRAVTLDTATKDAIRRGDVKLWASALDDCERFTGQH